MCSGRGLHRSPIGSLKHSSQLSFSAAGLSRLFPVRSFGIGMFLIELGSPAGGFRLPETYGRVEREVSQTAVQESN
jgi:hypothetical protein